MGPRDDGAACRGEEVSTEHSPSCVDAYLVFSAPWWTTGGRYLGGSTESRVRGEFNAYVWINGAYVPLDSARYGRREAGAAGRSVTTRGVHSA